MKVTALVVAAGSGSRMLTGVPKQFLLLDGQPIVSRTLAVFETVNEVQEVTLVVPEGQEERCRREWVDAHGLKKVSHLVPGGKRRQDSVYAGLQMISPETDIVLVHDGVRPFVTSSIICRTIEAAARCGGALVAIPVKDTVKKAGSDGRVSATLDRTSLWLAQTPQAFRKPILMEAYQKAYIDGVIQTDDAALVERLGYPVQIIEGAWDNLKITRPDDLLLAQEIVRIRHRTKP
jgi:2-C-methyl-D-erythritol 4-phosphate cytidylyltransferase